MPRIMRYILQHDAGMAPCVDDGLITLATCKPKIRATAKEGDWVVGCRPSPDERGLVVWAARVARIVSVGDYEREYRGRSDAVYRATTDGGFERLVSDYHKAPEDFRRDTTAPVLIFAEGAAWYFGREPHLLPKHLMHLAAGGRGHRVAGATDHDADALMSWLLSIAASGVHAEPSEGPPMKQRGSNGPAHGQKCYKACHKIVRQHNTSH